MLSQLIIDSKRNFQVVKCFIAFFLITLLFSCADNKSENRIVYLKYADELNIQNRSIYFDSHFPGRNQDSIYSLMLRNGDLLNIDHFFYLHFNDFNQDTIELIADTIQFGLEVNGSLYGIIFETLEFMDTPQSSYSDDQLSEVRFVSIYGPPSKAYMDQLLKLSSNEVIPAFSLDSVSLTILKDININPETLVFSVDTSISNAEILGEFTSLKNLSISFPDDDIDFEWPELPKLESLIISNNDPLIKIPFSKMPKLKTLKLDGFNSTMINEIVGLRDLHSLSISSPDSILILQNIDTLNQLSRLILDFKKGTSVQNLERINHLESLSWLGIPTHISQQKFDNILGGIADIESLELFDCHDSLSLSELVNLSKLNYLRVSDTLADRQSILKLKNLDLLSIPKKAYNDSLYLAKLKLELPNTTIVPNEGVCMGSGWLLLVIPLILFMLIFRIVLMNKKRSKI